MISNEKIKTFVKQVLGCACPEEVFKYIEYRSNIKINDVMLSGKINIGNKLLIYVVELNNPNSIKSILTFLVNAGKRERDDSRFNRFRLVLATDRLNEIKQDADVIFKTIDKDERVHLHVIPKNDILIF